MHTNHPGHAFEKGLTLGYLTNMKIDNMRIEHHERVIGQAERDEAEKQEEERQHRKQDFLLDAIFLPRQLLWKRQWRKQPL